jgi:hypothetical protein
MKAVLSKSSMGKIRSKILDPKYNTAELIFEVNISPIEFAKIITKYDEKDFELTIS